MKHFSPQDLWSLEEYHRRRPDFRARVIEHKRRRTAHLGKHVTLLFEDATTIRYQIQEMLRIERTFDPAGIQDELDAYNPLIPDGGNLKATMLIEYADPLERAERLRQLKGIERATWLQVDGHPRVFAIADEDLQRENEQKTSSVHFLRFEFDHGMRRALKGGAALAMGIGHPQYAIELEEVAPELQAALAADLD